MTHQEQPNELCGRGKDHTEAIKKRLHSITRTLAGARKIDDRPIRGKSRQLVTDQEEYEKVGQSRSGIYPLSEILCRSVGTGYVQQRSRRPSSI